MLLDEHGTKGTRRERVFSNCVLDVLTDEDVFTLYIAAVGHDVGHPGLTNAFMVCIFFSDHSIRLRLTACIEKCPNPAFHTL